MFKLILVGTIIVIAVIVIAVIPRTKGTTTQPSKIETMSFSVDGVRLVSPNDSTFDKFIAEKTDKGAVDSYAVYVVNQGARSVAACLLKWELAMPDGNVITHTRARKGSLEIIAEGQVSHFSDAIPPNGKLLFSLTDADPGGGRKIRMGGGGADINRQAAESVKITVSIDGILFADGTFVGTDSSNYFEALKGEVDAKSELNTEIARLADKVVNPDALLNHLEKYTKVTMESQQPSSSDNTRYSFWKQLEKKSYANRLQLMRRSKGDRFVVDFVKAEIGKPQIALRKI
ncbi:MAG: hypothetical protein AB1757_10075 [Acidobacteriota bacterium]